jgi:quinol monooxygenase YgiN
MSSEIFIFARFHAKDGLQHAVAAAIREVMRPTRQEPGCLSIYAYSATRDPRLFYVHSHWTDEAAFNQHALLPHTVRFVERVQSLIDHPLDVTRTLRSP